jgi:hypothetical protein
METTKKTKKILKPKSAPVLGEDNDYSPCICEDQFVPCPYERDSFHFLDTILNILTGHSLEGAVILDSWDIFLGAVVIFPRVDSWANGNIFCKLAAAPKELHFELLPREVKAREWGWKEDRLGKFDLYVWCEVQTDRSWAVKGLEALLRLLAIFGGVFRYINPLGCMQCLPTGMPLPTFGRRSKLGGSSLLTRGIHSAYDHGRRRMKRLPFI